MAIDRDAALKRAEKFLRQGKLDGAILEYVRLVEEYPRDWASINALGDLYVRAGDIDRGVEQFTRVADYLFAEGFFPKAQAVYKKALKIHSTHEHTLLQLVEIGVRQGLLVDARQHLRTLHEQRRFRGDARGMAECVVRLGMLEDADTASKIAAAAAAEQLGNSQLASELLSDPDLLLGLAAQELEAGNDREALQRIMRVLTQSPDRAPTVMQLARQVAVTSPERAYACVDLLADTALLEGDPRRAAEYLNEFVQTVPHIPALTKLVEICVDADLDWLMRETQGRLAEAYQQAGRDAEAKAILDDLNIGLVAVERPEDVVDDDFFADLAAPVPQAEPATPVTPVAARPETFQPASGPAEDAIVIEALEIDLSEALTRLDSAAVLPPTSPPAPPVEPPPALEEVFERMRAQASRNQMASDAAGQLETALDHLRAGREDEAIPLLREVARVPAFRFTSAARLGELYLRRGATAEGIEWLERAAEAPAPGPDEGHALLYQLGAALEQSGESARALAILLELQADTPGYRDVSERIDRLTREQAGSHLT